jgi:hypothetical protein
VSILERATQTRARLDELQQLTTDTQRRQRIVDRIDRLRRLVAVATELADAAVELRRVGRRVPVEVSLRAGTVMEQVRQQHDLAMASVGAVGEEAFTAMLDEVRALIGDARDDGGMSARAGSVLGVARHELREQWRGFLEEDVEVAAVSEELLQALGRLSGRFRNECVVVRERLAVVRQLQTKPLPTAGDAQRARDAAARLAEAWRDLGSGSITEGVRTFLLATTRPGGALASLLTPEVRSWLEDNTLLDRFRIRQSGT